MLVAQTNEVSLVIPAIYTFKRYAWIIYAQVVVTEVVRHIL